jgi:DNA invertase Pin-like site-specific DNA recombinase
VKFKSLTEAIDTATPAGRAMWQMIGIMAEFEHSLISERTRAGVKDAKRRGHQIRAQAETHTRADCTCPQAPRAERTASARRRPVQG